jgi:hypothetical protein
MKGDSFERVKRASFWVRGGGLSSGVSVISSPTSTTPTGGDDLGGWLIGDDAITGDNVIINKGGWISLGSGNASVTISAANPSWRLWAGNTDANLAPFRISAEGILWAEDAHVSGEITASSGSLGTLSVDGTLTISATGKIESENYVAGASGLYIDGQGNAEFNDIKVRGTLQTVVFEYDQVSAQSGGIIVTPRAGVLAQSYTTGGTMVIEGDTWAFSTGDTVRIRAKTITGTVAEVWVTVTRTAMVNQYTTTKRSGADATWPVGTAVLGYGTGGGTLVMTASLSGVGPYYSVRTHSTAPWTDEVERVRLGNLNGSFGISSDSYGVGIGDYSSGDYLRYDPPDGFVISGGGGFVSLTGSGLSIRQGLGDSSFIRWLGDDLSTSIARIGAHQSGSGRVSFSLSSFGYDSTDQEGVLYLTATPYDFPDCGARISLYSGYVGKWPCIQYSATEHKFDNYLPPYDDCRVEIWGSAEIYGALQVDTTSADVSLTAANIKLSGVLQRVYDTDTYTGYIVVPLATPATSTSYDGDYFSDVSFTEIDLSSAFGLPDNIKGIFARISFRDSGSSTTRCYAGLSGVADEMYLAVVAEPPREAANNVLAHAAGFVPCNANGNVYLRVEASGTNTAQLWIQIYGYVL